MRCFWFHILWAVSSFAVTQTLAAETLRLAVTTSFHNSGLSSVLLPVIQEDTGLAVDLLVVGTGQALKLGQQGDVDAVLVHSKAAEERFIKQGHAIRRTEIMYNDFVLIGPKDDPANIAARKNAHSAFAAIARSQAPFVSRGDESGTHQREQLLWDGAGLDNKRFEHKWYREVGAGMGAALNIASALSAYILADRASWLNFRNKGRLALLYAGDPLFFNQYSLLILNPRRYPHVQSDRVRQLERWLTSKKGQRLIGSYSIDNQRLFTPNAK